MFRTFFDRLPLVAILRGISPDAVAAVGRALADAGFAIIEVPLNSPRPFESIERLRRELGDDYLVGAGTVTTVAQVAQVAAAGGRLIVMPHGDAEIVRAAKAAGLCCTPGIVTPTEGFAALALGADALKVFPSEAVSPAALRAMRTVFPADTLFVPVGGITPDSMAAYLAAGASGFGLGSALYVAGASAAHVAERAHAFARAWRALRTPTTP